MSKWTAETAVQLTKITKWDAEYQQLLQECREMERDYRRILDGLSHRDQLLLDRYIAFCEEQEYRYAQLAYQYGVSKGCSMAIMEEK